MEKTKNELKAWGMIFLALLMMLFTVSSVLGLSPDFGTLNASCFSNSESLTGIGVSVDFGTPANVTNRTVFKLRDDCSGGNEIEYTGAVDLVLGPVDEGEVVITSDSIYVDTNLRPDLDKPAIITFRDQPFAVQPGLLRDGEECSPPDCQVISYISGEFEANVSGFSNYSLQGRQDFQVHSDEAPELQGKVYQVLDIGDSNRAEEFACVVMIFAEDRNNELVLVQTNPERQVQAKLLGNPDQNQPESLGYFPTTKGVANVYFRNDLMVGYTEFQYVAQCNSNSTNLVYEETIIPVHSPLGRGFASRAVWLTTDNDGENAFFLVLYVIGGFVLITAVWFALSRLFGGG